MPVRRLPPSLSPPADHPHASIEQRRVSPSSDEDEGNRTDYSDDAPARRKSTSKKSDKGKGKKKQRTQRNESSEEDMDGDSEDGGGGGGGKGKKGELSEDDKKHYIQLFVRYVLFNEAHRRPVKREDIVKNVLTDPARGSRGKHFNALLPKVQKVLKEVLGMEMVLLRAKDGAAGKNPPKSWVLRSTLPSPILRYSSTIPSSYLSTVPSVQPSLGAKQTLRDELASWEEDGENLSDVDLDGEGEEEGKGGVMRDSKREEGASYGILGVVLALILVNGKVLADDQLISYLLRLSLSPSTPLPLSLSSVPPTLSSTSSSSRLTLSAYLNTLSKNGYLERAKISSGGGGTQATQKGRGTQGGPARTQRATAEGEVKEAGDPTVEWRWGARAEVEFGELGVAKFVERIFYSSSSASSSFSKKGGGSGGGGGKRGRTGEKFLNEVARAAGVKKLRGAEEAEGRREE
ncbi:hypothetical protein JCM8547_003319 [Rhodosporidiobolus lusitaniae]